MILPGDFNYTTQKNIFDKLYAIVGGQKLIALSENGPIPDIQKCLEDDAPWSYFMSWSDLVFSQNSTQHIIDVYSQQRVLTLENPIGAIDPVVPPVIVPPITTALEQEVPENKMTCFPNPFTDTMSIQASGLFTYTVYSVTGNLLETNTSHDFAVMGVKLSPGIYLIKVASHDAIKFFKVVKN